jgi:hypothetical protein
MESFSTTNILPSRYAVDNHSLLRAQENIYVRFTGRMG